MKKIVAVMPIKTNNERLPGKNTRLLNGRPLLQYELSTLSEVDRISDIYVYCSDDEIRAYLPSNIIYKKRSPILDEPTSNFTMIFKSFMNEVDSDIYVYAHATAPFVSKETIEECIDKVTTEEYDSAFCATKIQDFLWENGKPLNFDAANIPRSQDLGVIYRETSGVYVFTRKVFLETNRRIGTHPYIKEVSYKEAVDINTAEDFKLAELLVNW